MEAAEDEAELPTPETERDATVGFHKLHINLERLLGSSSPKTARQNVSVG